MRSEKNRIYEADLAFYANGSAALVATTAAVGEVELDYMADIEGDQRGRIASETVEVIIMVTAIDTADGDETYTFDLNVGPVGLAGATQVQTMTVNAVGQWVMIVDASTLEKMHATPAALGLGVTIAGTTPSIEFVSWMAQG